jgi:hypothetical protein
MTNYEYCETMAKACKEVAEEKTDNNLKRFYKNAARGFELRKKALSISEAENERRR